MPAYYGPLFAAVRTGVTTIWPETEVNGVYQGPEIAAIPLERKAEEGELPFAVVDYGLSPSETQGAANAQEAGPVTIYHVVRRDDNIEGLIQRLVDLQTYFYGADLGGILVPEIPHITFSLTLPLNQFFLNSQRPFWAGAVIVQFWLNEFLDEGETLLPP